MSSTRPDRRRTRVAATTAALAAALLATVVPAGAAAPAPTAGSAPGTAVSAPGLDRGALGASLEAIHAAGMYGVNATVRDGGQEWLGAAGVADVDTGRPMRPGLQHRVGSVTKAFTAVAVLQ